MKFSAWDRIETSTSWKAKNWKIETKSRKTAFTNEDPRSKTGNSRKFPAFGFCSRVENPLIEGWHQILPYRRSGLNVENELQSLADENLLWLLKFVSNNFCIGRATAKWKFNEISFVWVSPNVNSEYKLTWSSFLLLRLFQLPSLIGFLSKQSWSST